MANFHANFVFICKRFVFFVSLLEFFCNIFVFQCSNISRLILLFILNNFVILYKIIANENLSINPIAKKLQIFEFKFVKLFVLWYKIIVFQKPLFVIHRKRNVNENTYLDPNAKKMQLHDSKSLHYGNKKMYFEAKILQFSAN